MLPGDGDAGVAGVEQGVGDGNSGTAAHGHVLEIHLDLLAVTDRVFFELASVEVGVLVAEGNKGSVVLDEVKVHPEGVGGDDLVVDQSLDEGRAMDCQLGVRQADQPLNVLELLRSRVGHQQGSLDCVICVFNIELGCISFEGAIQVSNRDTALALVAGVTVSSFGHTRGLLALDEDIR